MHNFVNNPLATLFVSNVGNYGHGDLGIRGLDLGIRGLGLYKHLQGFIHVIVIMALHMRECHCCSFLGKVNAHSPSDVEVTSNPQCHLCFIPGSFEKPKFGSLNESKSSGTVHGYCSWTLFTPRGPTFNGNLSD
ncbi:hypothetical protein SLEP1_g6531 [Rubroshorea leprosula]|uniref:Uncharacterized protein n=1 Tax=Rubroshorea leprosula TaxID=152421 RepID=A0AAV5I4E6_9ROSI|nr:hypothetical protein SLEP1_g6531 [Rubroshorea leprosula]